MVPEWGCPQATSAQEAGLARHLRLLGAGQGAATSLGTEDTANPRWMQALIMSRLLGHRHGCSCTGYTGGMCWLSPHCAPRCAVPCRPALLCPAPGGEWQEEQEAGAV